MNSLPTQNNINETSPASYKSKHKLKNKIGRFLWIITYNLFFKHSPPLFSNWRRLLLILFGAKIGNIWIHPKAQIWAPWLLEAGDDVFIDRNVFLYNTYGIKIANRVIISANVVLCTPSHNYENPFYPLIGNSIVINNDCWICADAYVLPGIHIGTGAVIGARSVVTKNVDEWTVVAGNPARRIKERKLNS